MDLADFAGTLSPKQRTEFCRLAGTNKAYLSQLIGGHRKASINMAKSLVAASRKLFPDDSRRWLTLAGVRPDIWGQAA